jgi:hypothetical protein
VQQALGERELVQRVLLVAIQRITGSLGDRLARTLAAVVHVGAVAAFDPDGPHFDRPGRQQVADHVAGLAAEGGAQHHRDAQRGDHPGLPDPLPAGMDVHVRVPRAIFDRHRDDGQRREDDHRVRHAAFLPVRRHRHAAPASRRS